MRSVEQRQVIYLETARAELCAEANARGDQSGDQVEARNMNIQSPVRQYEQTPEQNQVTGKTYISCSTLASVGSHKIHMRECRGRDTLPTITVFHL